MKGSVVITSYENPDLDGVSCVLGYHEFLTKQGKEASPCIVGTPHPEAQFVLDRVKLSLKQCGMAEQIILVDTSTAYNLPKIFQPEQVVEIIDHRRVTEVEKFPNAKAQIELVGAAATLIAEKFYTANIKPSQPIAILLYGAIVSNTLNFKAKVTTDRDKAMARWLQKVGEIPANFTHEMVTAKSDLSGSKLQESFYHDVGVSQLGGIDVGIWQLEIIEGEKLVHERKDELMAELAKLKHERNLKLIFLTIVDLEADQNLLVSPDLWSQEMLAATLGVRFNNGVARRPGLIMRKEIAPLLKERLANERR